MTWIFVWLVAVALSQVAGGPPPTESDLATLAHLEADWNLAHLHGDAAALDHLFADDLVVVPS